MTSAIKKFEIHLEHDIDEQYQYEPGEQVRGEVLLSTTEELRVCSVQVQVRGEATVSWDDEVSGDQFSAKETYIDTTVELPLTADVGGPASGQRKTSTSGTAAGTKANQVVAFGKGDHTFPLEISLPSTLPSSFIGKFGSITYVLKATIREDKLMGLGTTITSEPFLVLRHLDIQDDEKLQKPATTQLSRRVAGRCFLVCSGLVEAHFTIDKTGLLPGDEVVINGQIDNSSRRLVKSVQASLLLNSTFHAKNKVREHSQVVTKKSDSCEVEDGDTRQWTNVRLAIPPYIPESRLDGCDMIDIAYEMQFRVELDGNDDLIGSIPITIGTVYDERRAAARRKTWNPNNFMVGALQTTDNVTSNEHYDVINTADSAADIGMDDVELHEEVMDRFRHPIGIGEVRRNILYEEFDEKL
jgi:hypothetical protein